MPDERSAVEFSSLPSWADRLVDRLDEEYGVRTGARAEANFPDGQAPRWLRGDHRSETDGPPQWLDSFLMDGDPSLRKLWMDEGFLATDPEWLADLVRGDKADTARVFLLTGNVDDYAFSPDSGYMPVVDRIEENAVRRKDWVIRYSLSSGFARPIRGASTPEDAPSPFEVLEEDPRESHGVQSARSPREALDRDLRVLEELLRESYDGGLTVIFDNFHLLAPPDSTSVNQNVITDAISRWAQAPWMFQSKNQVVLLSETTEGLAQEFHSRSSHISSLTVPRPESRADRLKFLAALFAGARVSAMTGIRLDDPTRPKFDETFGSRATDRLRTLADRTSGLNLVGLENLMLELKARDDEALTMGFIKEVKRDLIARESGGLLEVSEPAVSMDRTEAFDRVGGLDAVCDRLVHISRLMNRASASESIRRSLPSGLLFLGPPGTGKTLVARAFADACGVNFAELGDIRSMYVGESERNLSQALDLIESLKPVIVFMDELDQTMGRRGGANDSGVDQRLFARILQFMSRPDLNGEVVWIAASNEPGRIDPALKRAGRFDMTIPFLRPDAAARREILQVNFADRGTAVALSEADWERVVDATEGYTGAELERVAKEAIWNELLEDDDPTDVTVTGESIDEALASYAPPADRSEFDRMENEALVEVTAVDMLTPDQRSRRERLIRED